MNRRDVVAAAAWIPWLTFEVAELRRGPDGMPYTRYVRKVPRPLRKALLIVLFAIAWHHFDDH